MQTVVITGGSAGIGRAVAEMYVGRGNRVGLIARGQERLHDAADALYWLGSCKVEIVPVDVWINAAMTTVYAPFVEMSAAEYERVTQVVYLGTVNGTRAALRRMRSRRHGAIVNVGSGSAQTLLIARSCCYRHTARQVRDPRLHRGDPRRADPSSRYPRCICPASTPRTLTGPAIAWRANRNPRLLFMSLRSQRGPSSTRRAAVCGSSSWARPR